MKVASIKRKVIPGYLNALVFKLITIKEMHIATGARAIVEQSY